MKKWRKEKSAAAPHATTQKNINDYGKMKKIIKRKKIKEIITRSLISNNQ